MTLAALREPVLACLVGLLAASAAPAGDWPMWGRDATRNPVSPETGLPLDFRFRMTDDAGRVVQAGRGVAWTARVGDRMVVPPVVADGLVWVCASAADPGDDKVPDKDWDGGVLACLREADGRLVIGMTVGSAIGIGKGNTVAQPSRVALMPPQGDEDAHGGPVRPHSPAPPGRPDHPADRRSAQPLAQDHPQGTGQPGAGPAHPV